MMVIHTPKDGDPQSQVKSSTIQRLVANNPQESQHHPMYGHLAFIGLVDQYPNDGHPPSVGWSPSIPRMFTQHLQDGQLNLEFHSSSAQLVFFLVHYCLSLYAELPPYPLLVNENVLKLSSFLWFIWTSGIPILTISILIFLYYGN